MMEPPHVALLGKALSKSIAQATSKQFNCPEVNYRPHFMIQSGNDSNIPIFCVPGAGDNVVEFLDFADALGPAWPLHGLQPRGSDGILAPYSTVEAAAAKYIQEILEIRPDGQVHLLGHSFGGWVALEMAYQLRAQNLPVASLTMIDCEVPHDQNTPDHEYTSLEVLQKLIRILELNAEKSLGIDSSEFESSDGKRQLELLHQGMVRTGLVGRNSKTETLRGVIRTFGASLRTVYRPFKLYTDPVRLVLVSDAQTNEQANQRQHQNILNGWRRLVPNLTYWHGPGNHMTVLKKPQVNSLADWWIAGLTPEQYRKMH